MSTNVPTTDVPPPRTRLPWWRAMLFGLQHVIVMYTGCVAVPLVFGAAMGLDQRTIGILVNADLLVAGVITIIQALGIKKILGARLPVVAGASFTAVTPMILIGEQYGLSAVYGAMIAAGVFGVLVAVPFSRLLRFFPPVVRGAAVTMIGLSLIGKAVSMIFDDGPADGQQLALAGGIILVILALMRYGRGFLSQAAVLIALVAGTLAAMALQLTDFSAVGDAAWFGLPQPFLFGAPTFPIAGIISMCIVMLVIFTETTAYLLSIGETIGKPPTQGQLSRGLAADGVSAVLAGLFTSFPDTVFAQNVGLVRMTGITSRNVVAIAGGILIALGLVPKMGELVASLPGVVIGAVSLVMFATVAGVGISTLAKVDFGDLSNFLITSIALGIGMIPVVAPQVYADFPAEVRIIFGGAISSTVIVAFTLNLVFNHVRRPQKKAKTPA
ncbi:purine permease [Microbacterium paludicola]|uniref:Purine permease n=1 Tax=Microbacterium paludicola TaxID=300019 RepID=A0A4Y9FVS9_9MICO|nr:nucleobase:cation symporter-2 family protein [Microbacterium paludicola]MBF0816291.1 purine permease [Microbacterium paludicola]TFU33089.1 purine permease [Microbacterium paludicola]